MIFIIELMNIRMIFVHKSVLLSKWNSDKKHLKIK